MSDEASEDTYQASELYKLIRILRSNFNVHTMINIILQNLILFIYHCKNTFPRGTVEYLQVRLCKNDSVTKQIQ